MSRYCQFCLREIPEQADICPNCKKSQNYVSPAHQLSAGTILNRKYVVGQVLGEGGFGITYVGRDITLDLKIAIKEFYPNGLVNRNNTVSNQITLSADQKRKEAFIAGKTRFLKEARTLAKFSNDSGIVNVRDFFEQNHTAYIVMEYLEGITLERYILKNGLFSEKDIVILLTPVMHSLEKIHAKGLIHRDISPENIMLTKDSVKLLDFGAAREVANLSRQGLSVVLKPGYAPEEQYRSKGEQGPWSDVYALCGTIYRCITGHVPTDSTQRAFEDDLLKPSQMGIACTPAFEETLMRGLSVHKQERIQSMNELLNAFYRALNLPLPATAGTVQQQSVISTEMLIQKTIVQNTQAQSIPGNVSQNISRSVRQPSGKSMSKPPVSQAKPPVSQAKPPVSQAKPSVSQAKPPVSQAKPPVLQAKPEQPPRQPRNAVKADAKSKLPLIIIAACVAVVVIAGIVTAAVLLSKKKDSTPTTETTQNAFAIANSELEDIDMEPDETTVEPDICYIGDVDEANDSAVLDLAPFWLTDIDPMRQLKGNRLYSITINAEETGSFTIYGYDEVIDRNADSDELSACALSASEAAYEIAKIELKPGVNTYYFNGDDSSVTILEQSAIDVCPTTLGFCSPDDSGIPLYNADSYDSGYHNFCFEAESSFPGTAHLAFNIEYIDNSAD